MTESSPIVGKESPIYIVPAFYQNQAAPLDKKYFPSHIMSTIPGVKPYKSSKFRQNVLSKYAAKFRAARKPTICRCPHVLIADDDPFQHLYYQSFFHKSMDFQGIIISKENLRITLCHSGEELKAKFEKVKNCGCDTLMLIIIDYFMGKNNLNGVDTCVKLRETGYKGPLLLRTGESKEFLRSRHKGFDDMLERKLISEMVGKDDLKGAKELMQTYMQRMSKGKENTN